MPEHIAYRNPPADREPASNPAGRIVTGPHSVAAARGAAWVLEGFDFFRASPMHWIAALIVLFTISLLASLIPLGTLALNVLNPVFTAGFVLGCHRQRQVGRFNINDLFAGFSTNFGQLLLVGVIMLGGAVAITAIVLAVAGLTLIDFSVLFSDWSAAQVQEQIHSAMLADPERMFLPLSLIALTVLGLSVPLLMALWFAPALVALNGLGAMDAMVLSFEGCLLNVVPFLLYGIVALALLFVSLIPFGLGLLITLPMITASLYIAYRDVFTG